MNTLESELIRSVLHYAPILGTALAGPAGGIVGSLINSVFGSKNNDDLYNKIQSDPCAADKLKQIEQEHEIELKRLSIQQSAIDAVKSIVEME